MRIILSIFLIQAQAQFGAIERTRYLSDAIDALMTSRYQSLIQKKIFANMLMKQRCTSSFQSLKTQCLTHETGKTCRELGGNDEGRKCTIIFDVIIVNLLNQEVFLSTDERNQLLKKYAAEEIGHELNRRYGTLCTEFLFSPFFPKNARDRKQISESIDKFCLNRASLGKLSWQVCSSAMVWFMGSSRGETPNGS